MSDKAFTRAEWCAFVNRMLEAERAGARALLEFLGEYPRDGEGWKVLRRVQGDEAHNCVLLGEVLKGEGEPYSHATGEFLDKALAVRGRRARLEMQKLFGSKVYLGLWVKVREGWSDDARVLRFREIHPGLFVVAGYDPLPAVSPEVRIYQALEKWYGERRTPRFAILAEKLSRPVAPAVIRKPLPPPPDIRNGRTRTARSRVSASSMRH